MWQLRLLGERAALVQQCHRRLLMQSHRQLPVHQQVWVQLLPTAVTAASLSTLASTHRLQEWQLLLADGQSDLLEPSLPKSVLSKSSSPKSDLSKSSSPKSEATAHIEQPHLYSTLWHSAAHILGWALESHYGDDCLLTNGPATEQGFYYDSLLVQNGHVHIKQRLDALSSGSITSPLQLLDPFVIERDIASLINGKPGTIYHPKEADLDALSVLMEKQLSSHLPFTLLQVSREKAAWMFAYSPFKLLYLSRIPADEVVTLYRCGSFIDLCRGPHVNSTKAIGGMKLLRTGATQWSSDSPHNISRIHGIAFPTGKALREWTLLQKEAADRDHRHIGRKQSLFYFSPVSPGAPFFMPHGTRIVQRLTDLLRSEYRRHGFDEIITPLVFNKSLWDRSGHWQNYKEDMFAVSGCCSGHSQEMPRSSSREEESQPSSSSSAIHNDAESDHPMQALKPMNCPGHCLLFGSTTRSYRDLPIRYAEFSPLHRNEASGALTGLTRVRKFHQDDGHIFCTPAQVSQEIASTLSFIDYMYTVVFQFPHYKLALSTRPTDGYVGELAQWDIAESALRETLDASGREWSVQEGEGAFYGPKIDVSVRDALGRYHQTATIQLDFQLPARFGLTYQTSGADGEGVGATDTPVMVHRAILGSIERMLAILTEHWGGRWPFWISPRQAIVVPVNDKLNAYAQHIKLAIARGGHGRADLHGAATEATPMSSAVSTPHYYVDVDSSNNLLSKRIREAQLLQYNYILVVGDKELEAGTVSVRTRTGKRLGEMTVAQVLDLFAQTTATFTMES
ncbi:hypothetical protein BASA50_001523 [Batrachochytrium salamandrivorans]|uniref:threonine--tRNA ligase n=1 Tax=Batrachochytrium salamandrivorans TaxID=1357716 RepID=A0ABQ8FRW7_9FUNG|nr:hypothetical protein BASA50_001523 [Batrachochytrium salamandrivorans]